MAEALNINIEATRGADQMSLDLDELALIELWERNFPGDWDRAFDIDVTVLSFINDGIQDPATAVRVMEYWRNRMVIALDTATMRFKRQAFGLTKQGEQR
jgi:hypothetical protein